MTGKTCKNMVLSQFELSKITLKNLNKFDLSPSAKLVLLALVDCYNPKNEEIFPKQKTVAAELGISERSVVRAIKELVDCQVIIYEWKNQNRYKLTSKFFESAKMSLAKGQNVVLESAKLSCHEQIHEKKKNNLLSFKTDFQQKYADILEKLSEYDLKTYSALKGYEKEEWLKAKRKEFVLNKESLMLQFNIEKSKQNTGSPLDMSKNEAIKFLGNLMPELQKSFFAQELRKKWKI